ncbi:MAG TPA: GerW family sporulation protein [Lachnospiraceae bacterium]|jgi:uncharacterized spore protein YtfJ|nr:GerW family sporulation protein [Lachnospiraceae bacterium]
MTNSNINSVVETLIKGMDGFLSSKTVVGEATKIDDTIILPFVDVTFGVGAGEFAGEKKSNGGGGLSGKMSPSAVLVIQKGSTRLVNIKNQDSMTKILDMVPDLVNKFAAKKEDVTVTDDKAVEVAFEK